jgi:hypothetical protein
MIQYKDFAPTTYDRKGLYCKDRQEWLVAPCGNNRDANLVTQANWESQMAALKELGEGKTWEVCNFRHWGPGWFEIILIQPGSRAEELCNKLEKKLENHPILDEDHFSQVQLEEAVAIWRDALPNQRKELLRAAKLPASKAMDSTMPQGVLEIILERYSH